VNRLVVALLVFLATLAPAAEASANPSANPQASLEQGKLAYQRHEYGTVVDTVQPLLYPSIELGSEDSVVEAHRLLALAFFFMKKMPEARHEVVSILSLRPGYELDPIVEPPVAVRFFQHIRREQDERLQEVRQRQLEEEEYQRKEIERKKAAAHAKAERVFVERTVTRRSRLIALVPFGVGQAQNGDYGKAWLFGVSEAMFGALSLASWITLTQRYPTGKYPSNEQDLQTTLMTVQLASGAAFWGMLIAGIVEAQVRLVPESVKTRELPDAPRKKDAKIGFIPLLSPTFYGIGVQGVF
jgi:hypothetical protein